MKITLYLGQKQIIPQNEYNVRIILFSSENCFINIGKQNIINTKLQIRIKDQQMNNQTLSDVNKTLEYIIDQGADTLYQQYLSEKIPDHLTNHFAQTISQVFDGSSLPFDRKELIKREYPIKPVKKQNRLQNKIKVEQFQRPHSQLSSHIFRTKNKTAKKILQNDNEQQNTHKIALSLKLRKKAIDNNQQQQIQPWKKIPPSNKPNFSIKYSCQKVYEKDETPKIRKQLIQRNNMRKIVQEQIEKKRQQFITRRNKLQQEFQQLAIKGISYTYDYQSPQLIANITRDARGNIQQNVDNRRKNKKTTSLKYETIQYEVSGPEPKQQQLKGKKKSIFKNRIKRKPKYNQQQYNNNDKRQLSTIPFVTLNQGIKIVELNKNVIAERRKSQTISRQEFRQSTARKRFKSYLPQRMDSPLGLISTMNDYNESRPGTTGHLTTGKKTADTGISRRSILWRPNTTTSGGRVKVNKDLIEQIFQ